MKLYDAALSIIVALAVLIPACNPPENDECRNQSYYDSHTWECQKKLNQQI